MKESGKHKWGKTIFCNINGLQLSRLYDKLDKTEKPFSCVVKKAMKGVRWVRIQCDNEDGEYFENIMNSVITKE